MNLKKTLMILGVVLLLGPFLIFAIPQLTPWFNSYIVTSGSMEPSIATGSAILVKNTDGSKIEPDDIITFSSKDESGPATTTHRVINVTNESGELSFQTKGDANENPDPRRVPESAVVGKVAMTIPVLGKLIFSLDNVYGYVLLVVIPGAMMVVYELRRMIGELDEG